MMRMLCITAHPDDEVGAFGGTLLLYARRGIETHVICLTPGEAASHRGGARSDEELAEVRRREFAAACEILKVSSAVVLDYPDSKLDRVDSYAVVRDLAARIRRLQPHIVVTIGPEGAVTAHPDHSMAGILATLAYHWAGHPKRFPDQLQNGLRPHRAQKLYYATSNFSLPDRPPISPSPTTAIIDVGAVLETKIQAFAAHLTQRPLLPIFENVVRRRGAVELFHLAAAINPVTIEMETDLFAGVVE